MHKEVSFLWYLHAYWRSSGNVSGGKPSSLREDSEYSTDLLERWQNQEDRQEVWELKGKTSSQMHNSGEAKWILTDRKRAD